MSRAAEAMRAEASLRDAEAATPVKVLIVDDRPDDAGVLKTVLADPLSGLPAGCSTRLWSSPALIAAKST